MVSCRVVVAMVLLVAFHASAARAGQGGTRAPLDAQCTPCEPAEEVLRGYEAELAVLNRVIAERREEIRRFDAATEEARAAIREAKTSGDPKRAAGRIKELEDRIGRNAQGRRIAVDDQELNLTRRHTLEEDLIPEARDALSRCNATCNAADPLPQVLRGGAQPAEPAPGTEPEPRCQPCEPPADEFKRLDDERRQLAREAERLDREIDELERRTAHDERGVAELSGLANDAKATKQPAREGVARDMIKATQRRIDENTDILKSRRSVRDRARARIEEITPRLNELRNAVEKCNTSCPVSNTKWYLIGGGAVAAGLLTTVGGGSDGVTAPPTPTGGQAPPQSPAPALPPAPAPADPAPQPQPPAPPQPTVAGQYDSTSCGATADPDFHDRVFDFCRQVAAGAWDVLTGSITIRHAPPFVNIEALPFTPPSGPFSGAIRGSIAGFSNLRIDVAGTADAATGRIQFTYTIGAGGELPGGRPVTYAFTLQKRR